MPPFQFREFFLHFIYLNCFIGERKTHIFSVKRNCRKGADGLLAVLVCVQGHLGRK